MRLHARSVGPKLDPWAPRAGSVHSVFARAINLLVGEDMWTVLGAGRHDAPFGVRLAGGDSGAGFEVKPADCVDVRAGFLRVGRLIIDCRSASRWTPKPWGPLAPGITSRLAAVEERALARAWARSVDLATDVKSALGGSDAELASAVLRSVGSGPGMTPAGDDVLVGMLAVLSSGAAGPEGARLTARLRAALAPALSTTTDVSRHLLTQAARGLPARALHDLAGAIVEGATDAVLRDLLQVVLDAGSTSGGDACLGLVAACRVSFVNAQRAAA